MNHLYKSMNRRLSSLGAAPLAALGTALTSTLCPLATAPRQARGPRRRGLSMAVLLVGAIGWLGVVNPAFAQSCDHQGVFECVDEFPQYACKSDAPAKPTGLALTNTHDGIRLTWDRPSAGTGVLQYVIYRRVGGEESTLTEFARVSSEHLVDVLSFNINVGATIPDTAPPFIGEMYICPNSGGLTLPNPFVTSRAAPSFHDTFVTAGKNYIYRVAARTLRSGSDTDVGEWSSPTSRTFTLVSMNAPTGLSGSPNSNGLPVLSWTAPSTVTTGSLASQRSEPHGYQLRRSSDSGANWTELARPGNVNLASATATTRTDSSSSLAVSTGYIYQVRAVRKRFPTPEAEANITPTWQDGPWSASSATITTPATIVRSLPPPQQASSNPNPPAVQASRVLAQALPAGSAVLSASATQLDPQEVVTLTATTANVPDGMTPLYHFQEYGGSTWSTIFTGTTWSNTFSYLEASARRKAFRVRVTYGDDWYANSLPIVVTWGDNPAQTITINGENVTITNNNANANTQTSTPQPDETEEETNSETPDETAQSQQRSADEPEQEEESEPAQKPGRASGLQAGATKDSVSLAWSAPADGGPVSGYAILRRAPATEKNLQTLVADTGSTTTVYIDRSVLQGTEYIYRVQALGAGGQGQASQPAKAITPVERIGTDGNDRLVGAGGHDTLDGRGGNDVLRGLAGNDVLKGGSGDDTYTGGPGADRFVFAPSESGDKIITDFQNADRIVLSNAASGLWPSVSDILASEVQETSGYNVYTLRSGLTVETHVLLDAADFVVQQ